MDIQGEEYKVARYLLWHNLAFRVSVILVGTHSKKSHKLWRILLKVRGYKIYGETLPNIVDGVLAQDGEILAISKKVNLNN
jgi:hypothetical protein